MMSRWAGAWAVVVAAATLGSATVARGQATAGAEAALVRSLQEDATLVDVCFVDAQRGWAVGERGVIWSTSDGGREWIGQESGVDCRLTSVCFLDPQTGFIAGVERRPYSTGTRGVILRTRDGGRSWRRDAKTVLPGLQRMKFVTGAHGWALGEPTALFPGGVFVTDDGGQSWMPLPGMASPGWLTGDFIDAASGALAGRRGTLGVARRRGLELARTPALGYRGLNQMRLTAPAGGWLVGDGGLVLKTADLGRTWQLPPESPTAEAARSFDWKALAVQGEQAWIAGDPGTRVLHTPDGGRTWSWYDTGVSAPITGLSFVDGRQGWAVGALGTILATNDGGRSWAVQRAGGRRAAMLALVADAETTPLEMVARLSPQDGYLCVVEELGRRDVEPRVRGNEPDAPQRMLTADDRQAAALVAAGASWSGRTWQFPLRQEGFEASAAQLLAGWDRVLDGRGADRLLEHCVRRIRTWRPEVIVTHGADLTGSDPLVRVVNQTVLTAAEQAADPSRYPEHLQAGLRPWQAHKVIGLAREGGGGSIKLTCSQLAPRLGATFSDYVAPAWALWSEEPSPRPGLLSFEVLVDRVPQGAGSKDFFAGLMLAPGSDARRVLIDPPPAALEELARRAQRHRNVQAIVAAPESATLRSEQLSGQIGDLLAGLDARMAGELLFNLARKHHERGRAELAAETLELLVERNPNDPLAEPALAWLAAYWGSAECGWRAQRGQQWTTGGVAERSDPTAPLGQGGLTAPNTAAGRYRQGTAAAFNDARRIDRTSRGVTAAAALEELAPMAAAEPEGVLMRVAAQRRGGYPQRAEKILLAALRSRPNDAWRRAFESESWLLEPKGAPPRATLRCAGAMKPYLDGVLDDPTWRNEAGVALKSPLGEDANWPARVRMARDTEFLFLAIECRRAPGTEHGPAWSGPRPRDARMEGQDRVEVYLDVDRDHVTSWKLVVDQRGLTQDACFGDASWNPSWFVAVKSDESGWTAEAAIPRDELAEAWPGAEQPWLVGVQRIAPRAGFQSAFAPAAIRPAAEGFGWLIFE